ncbi:LacI family transcriptional regulator [Betaproteobacteria bacterium]|nr:LacI family transcriptional regulator [Betaproteobacteria bacterium]
MTIKDVAKRAQVSIATVSRVINNRGYLSDNVKAKVASAMEELDYHPNDLARSLHSQKSWLLGLIVPSVSHPFFGEITKCIEGYAYEQGYKVLICNSLQESEKERDYIAMLKRSQVDGIIMGSHTLETGDYQGLQFPLISLDRELASDIPYVCCDNYQGGELAANCLIEKGCRNVIHISGSLAVPMLSNKRTEAFIDVCKAAGITYHCFEMPDSLVVNLGEEESITGILTMQRECDGLFATSDITAAKAVNIALAMGRRVGTDFKVIGFDDNIVSGLMTPRLSTIRQPVDLIGRYAVEYLVRMIHGETVPTKTTLPVQLIERETTR